MEEKTTNQSTGLVGGAPAPRPATALNDSLALHEDVSIGLGDVVAELEAKLSSVLLPKAELEAKESTAEPSKVKSEVVYRVDELKNRVLYQIDKLRSIIERLEV